MKINLMKTSLLIIAISIISRGFGFLRDMIFASVYGLSVESDAFFMAQSITEVINGLIFAGISTTFTPIMSDYIANQNHDITNKFLNKLYTFLLLGVFLICSIGLIFTEKLVFIFAPNFNADTFNMTVVLARIMLPSLMLMLIATLQAAKLNNYKYYFVTASAGFPMNIALMIGMLFFSKQYGILSQAVAVLVGALFQILLYYPFSKKLGYKFNFDFDFQNDGLGKMIRLSIPVIIGSGLQQINTLIDRILSSGLGEGSVSALNLANRINVIIIALLLSPIISVFYTTMSSYYSTRNYDQFKLLLKKVINFLIILVIPTTVGFIVLRLPIVSILFERGVFDSNASNMTSTALQFYSYGLIGFALRDVLNRSFYSIKDTRTAMFNGGISVVINIILSIILSKVYGIAGLAFATSISANIGTILLMVSLHKRIGDFGILNIIRTTFASLTSGLIMGLEIKFVFERMTLYDFSIFSSLAVSLFIGLATYFIMLFLLKVEEVIYLLERIKIAISGSKKI